MTIFAPWDDLPPKIRAYLDTIEGFVGDVDGKTIATPSDDNSFIDDGIVEADGAVKATNSLVNEIRELNRTRAEAEAAARRERDLRKSIVSILGISL